MIILYALVVAFLIVGGQAFWKSAVNVVSTHNLSLLSAAGFIQLIKTPAIYIGVVLYATATVAFVILLSRYKYFQVQSLVVGLSFIFTLIIAATIFGENIQIINILGVCLVLIGAVLIIS